MADGFNCDTVSQAEIMIRHIDDDDDDNDNLIGGFINQCCNTGCGSNIAKIWFVTYTREYLIKHAFIVTQHVRDFADLPTRLTSVSMLKEFLNDISQISKTSKQDDRKVVMPLYNINRKVPGEIPPLPKEGSQGYLDDLSTKELFELEELLERQEKLLKNTKFISKLRDKGEKIKSFRDKIAKEIQAKDEIEKAANLLSRLNIASEGKAAMNELEWTGKYTENPTTEKIVELDSDDEDDPLKILAQPTGSGVHKKKVIHLAPEESLIKPEDLEDIKSFEDSVSGQQPKYVTDKVEKFKTNDEKPKKESFKPYKTTKSDVHDPRKELERKRNKYWEVTAATPPPSIHGSVKPLSIEESLILQRRQAEQLQEIQTQHALEKLAEQLGPKMGLEVPNVSGSFRTKDEIASSSSSEDEEENEVHDDEDTDKCGTVVFTVKAEEFVMIQ